MGAVFRMIYFAFCVFVLLVNVHCIEKTANSTVYGGINDLQNGTSERMHNSSFIGCFVWKQSIQYPAEGDTIIFDGITLNEGNAFQPAFSWFLCPHTAIYYVAVTLQKFDLNDLSVWLYVEDTIIFEYYETYSENPWNVISSGSLVRCSQGERIWLRGAPISEAVYGEPGIPLSTFTVMMMYQEDNKNEPVHETFIGASVYKTDEQTYNSGDIITFQEIFVDEGDFWIPDLNRYRCPTQGVYYIVTNARKDTSVNLQLGTEYNTLTILHTEDIWAENTWNQITSSGLIKCNEGEFISVKGTGDGNVSGNPTYKRTTFTAMLMYPDGSGRSHLHSSFVGFTAFKKSEQTYSIGDTIEFEGILINEGGHFQPVFNRFVCPFNGIYYVSVTFTKYSTNALQVGVEHQTDTLIRSVDTASENPWNVLTNTALVRCVQGEEIKVVATGSGAIYGDDSKKYTTFTIMLMYQY